MKRFHLDGQRVEVGLSGDDETDDVTLAGVSTHANVLDSRVDLQQALHLAQADVLPTLELHQVLLPVDYLQGPVSLDMEAGFKFTTLWDIN